MKEVTMVPVDEKLEPLKIILEVPIMRCQRCSNAYLWKKAQSTLKMTYCSIFCENSDLGFSLEQLERTTVKSTKK